MKIYNMMQNVVKKTTRVMVNELPARLINIGYNTYSKIYKGQLSLGLPVSRDLLISQEESKVHAVGKLALFLYHIIFRVTGKRITRVRIKAVLLDELEKGKLRLTEDVILLTRESLNHIIFERLGVQKQFLSTIQEEAERRFVLKEAIKKNKQPAYFGSRIDERENNGRGDYQTIFYQEFTDEGKGIGYRRLISMDDVMAGDDSPTLLLIPGFANNSNFFDMDNQYSLAKNMADMGMWVNLFDPRGCGINAGLLDPYYTVDTLIDYDLPSILNSIYLRSGNKPSVLVGHSMGGVVAENMVLNWALRCDFDKIDFISDKEKKILDKVLIPASDAEKNIQKVKGIISLGSPKFFKKKSHVCFPIMLWLNHLSRIFNMSQIPVRELSRMATEFPVFKNIARNVINSNIGGLNFLINPENFKNDRYFMDKYLKTSTDSIPLGLGFQFIRAIYDENGFKRMDRSNLNYSNCFSLFPKNIPLFHFWGGDDPVAPKDNIKYSKFYPHKIKKVYRLETVEDLNKVVIEHEPSQLIDFVIEKTAHLDLLYGETAQNFIQPLLDQIIETIWSGWSYEE